MEVREGVLTGGLPYLTVGAGPPLVALPGFTATPGNPTGAARRQQLSVLRPLAKRFTVHLIQPRPGLERGTSMGDLADDVARAIRRDLGAPVPMLGISTGGSIALQVAHDHPDVVSRLALLCAACRLSDRGRQYQRELARLTLAGHPRHAWGQLGPALAAGPITRQLMTAILWLTGTASDPKDPAHMLALIDAEDTFDLTHDLAAISTPTLVVGGGRDGYYSTELFTTTARDMPQGHLVLDPQGSHLSVTARRSAHVAITDFLTDETS